MKKIGLWLGMLVLALVFGMTVVGCVLFEVMSANIEARNSDGKGGDITINNTSDSNEYFVIYPDRDGRYTMIMAKRLTKNGRDFFSVDNDGSYLIYYRQVREGETPPFLRDEDYRTWWNSKSIFVSNDERVSVSIPY